MDKEIKEILEKGSLWKFLNKFPLIYMELATTLAWLWSDGKVATWGIKFKITMESLEEVLGLDAKWIDLNKIKNTH